VLEQNVARDPEQERTEASVGAKSGRSLCAREERALDEILDSVVGLGAEEPFDRFEVSLDQGFAGGPISAAPCLEQRLIVTDRATISRRINDSLRRSSESWRRVIVRRQAARAR